MALLGLRPMLVRPVSRSPLSPSPAFLSRFPLSCSMYSRESMYPCPWVNTFILPRIPVHRPPSCTCVYACKFVRDVRLPVRRESNAGSQPLQPAARLCFALTVATVNFSSPIKNENERAIKRASEREREGGGRNYYLFRINHIQWWNINTKRR